MTIHRGDDAFVRPPFHESAPDDYRVPLGTAEAVLTSLAGEDAQLYDPRYPGVIESYSLVDHHSEPGRVVAVLRHTTLEHCLEVDVRAVALCNTPSGEIGVADILATLGRPTLQYDPQDRGALEAYRLVERQSVDGRAQLIVRHTKTKREVEITLQVSPVEPRRAYEYALDHDDRLRRVGRTVYNERNPRPVRST